MLREETVGKLIEETVDGLVVQAGGFVARSQTEIAGLQAGRPMGGAQMSKG